MLSISELKDHFEIQGRYCIKAVYDDSMEIVAVGDDFEYDFFDIDDEYLDADILYMYVEVNMLNFEIDLRKGD